MDAELWVENLLSAWQVADICTGAKQAAACFSLGVNYQEAPFVDVLHGRSEVERYWLEMLNEQKDVRYSYDIVSWTDSGIDTQLVLNWRVRYRDVKSGETVSLNGISKGLFNDEGLCYDWREWWHKDKHE